MLIASVKAQLGLGFLGVVAVGFFGVFFRVLLLLFVVFCGFFFTQSFDVQNGKSWYHLKYTIYRAQLQDIHLSN